MKQVSISTLHYDFLVIGSGIAGLYTALQLTDYGKVCVITKAKKTQTSSSQYAQGGIAAALNPFDSHDKHIQDTLQAGAGLCDHHATKILVKEGSKQIQRLIELGIHFSKNSEGSILFNREGGHSENRVIHFQDTTGAHIMQFLIEKVNNHPNIDIKTQHVALELITTSFKENTTNFTKECQGAYIFNTTDNTLCTITSKFTVLATGGAGHVYSHTTNPRISTGDGIALAYYAGCTIRDLEFYQFHPTVFYQKDKTLKNTSLLISEILRGHGAKLGVYKEHKLIHFMGEYSPQKDLASRDIVSRAIQTELQKHNIKYVYLDATHLSKGELETYIPYIYNTLLSKFNIDASEKYIPVIPSAHYMCGGILTNYNAKTELNHLFAVGEVASTGVHGANRLASNSLIENFVFSHQAVQQIKKELVSYRASHYNILETTINKYKLVNQSKPNYNLQENLEELQQTMWQHVGIVRSNLSLATALVKVTKLENDFYKAFLTIPLEVDILSYKNLLLTAKLTILSAIKRKESRGLHFNKDYPETREVSDKHTLINIRDQQ